MLRHSVVVVVGDDVLVVVLLVVVVVVHVAQQLVTVPTVPPAVSQSLAEEATRHLVPQSLPAVQVTVGSFAQVPLGPHVLSAISQVTAPGFPQVDRAAQLTTRPLHRRGIVPAATSCLQARATHLT